MGVGEGVDETADGSARADGRRGADLDRVVTFVDAIVAIAITLLVLPLVELTGELGEEPVRSVLADHQGQLGSFLLSFVVIARLWWAQHAAVRRLARLPRLGFPVLMAWTLTIVFLPFPTALVALEADDAVTKILYIGTTALSMVALLVLEVLVARDPGCLGPESSSGEVRARAGVTAVNVGLLLVALAITLTVPATSYLPMLLLGLDNVVARLLGIRWSLSSR